MLDGKLNMATLPTELTVRVNPASLEYFLSFALAVATSRERHAPAWPEVM
jgi:hypothetical protein